MSNRLVSIIVPIYNSGIYLKRCIDSIVSQTFENIEVVLVDDGSTDDSGNICDEYAAKDKRILVIHKSNEGLVRARKDGVTASHGEFILLVDSDDWIDYDAVEVMLGIQELYKCDIVQSSVIYEKENGEREVFEEVSEGLFQMQEKSNIVLRNLFVDEAGKETTRIRPNIWGCLYKRELYLEHQMNVPDYMRRGEDDACYYPLVLSCNTMYLMKKNMYHFYQRSGSMSRSDIDFNAYEGMDLYRIILPKISIHPAKNELLEGFKKYLLLRTNDHFLHSFGIGYRKNYEFPFASECNEKKIVIYGAGAVGCSYVNWIENKAKEIKISLVFDAKKTGYIQGHKITNDISKLKDIKVDYIVVAVLKDSDADSIIQKLENNGIKRDCILWEKPKKSNGLYCIG